MTIDMTRHQGSKGVALVELASKRKQHYIVRTDIQNIESEEGELVDFIEARFPYKPSMNEIKDFCYGVINAQTDEQILTGFMWTPSGSEIPINVWLSEENQRNFSEAQRLAMVSPESVLPVKFKLGETSEGEPVYHTFETLEELNQFYFSAFGFIKATLDAGWQKKDSFDFTPYEEALNPVE